MNQYSQLLYYIKQLAESDPLVNTVVKDTQNIDLQKNNIYPLVEISITGGGFSNGSVVTFDVEVACMDIRDTNKEIITDKFWAQDNEVDNHNTTHAILNRMWTSMYRDFESNNITASENPTLEKATHQEQNNLDGWVASFTVEVPNTDLNLCS
jgi:hypothetical protein